MNLKKILAIGGIFGILAGTATGFTVQGMERSGLRKSAYAIAEKMGTRYNPNKSPYEVICISQSRPISCINESLPNFVLQNYLQSNL